MSFEALIFDCDGVLVNSEEIVQDIELELLAEHGLEYEREEFALRFLGVANDHFYRALSEDSVARLGRPLASSFADELHSRARLVFDTELKAFAGVEDVIHQWAEKLAVASSSSIAGLEYKLQKTGLKPFFDPHIYSAEHVGAGKPDPAIYLHTASHLNVQPEFCVVLEDSVNGVVSARAAGMSVVGFVAGLHCNEQQGEKLEAAGASFVVESMAELLDQFSDRGWLSGGKHA